MVCFDDHLPNLRVDSPASRYLFKKQDTLINRPN